MKLKIAQSDNNSFPRNESLDYSYSYGHIISQSQPRNITTDDACQAHISSCQWSVNRNGTEAGFGAWPGKRVPKWGMGAAK